MRDVFKEFQGIHPATLTTDERIRLYKLCKSVARTYVGVDYAELSRIRDVCKYYLNKASLVNTVL